MLNTSKEKVLGIIAEYNPFHLGHLYHLKKSIENTNAKYTVILMGGNFTQRGDCSIINKWAKTSMALQNGADLVIELPVVYNISSAENFAEGAIKILNELKIVDYLSFGAETDDINSLIEISQILFEEPKEFKKVLSNELNRGISFPKAREIALISFLKNSLKYKDIICSSNNILGIEYLKAIQKYNSNIKPFLIKRLGNNYNDEIITDTSFASATSIRNMLKNKGILAIKPYIPNVSYNIIEKCVNEGQFVYDISSFDMQIIYNLRKMSINEIANLPDVSEGLEFAIKKACNKCNSVREFISNIKSKRYTLARISRILLYALLDISKNDIELSKQITPYVRVLGFNSNGKKLLSEISKQNPDIKIITSVKKFLDINTDKNLLRLLKKDIFATDIYTLGYKNNSFGNLDFTQKIEQIGKPFASTKY